MVSKTGGDAAQRAGLDCPAPVAPHSDAFHALAAHLAFLEKGRSLKDRLSGGVEQGLLSAVAALIAYVPAQVIGLKEGFWGAITAISVLQAEFKATRTTARDQITGAAIGGLMALGVLFVGGENLVSYALAVVLSLLASWLLNVASSARLAGVTATIILLVPRAGTAQTMFLSRLSEVAWGICVAIALVWIANSLKRIAHAFVN